ncbi:MAG: cupin domain-containing protein [Chloroflexi bacterium]|nr:cupin domain-containing protein [Chloroflexota bacterium]
MSKPEYEFFDPLTAPHLSWRPVAGDATGQLQEMILSNDPETGEFTRLLRFPPGTDTSPNGTLAHDVWEEVWIVDGALHDLRLDHTYSKGMYACRPPGMPHGPWRSDDGCLTFEVRYRRSNEADAAS